MKKLIKTLLLAIGSVMAWGALSYVTLRFDCNGEIKTMFDFMGQDFMECKNILNWPSIIFAIILLVFNLNNFISLFRKN